MSKIVGAYKLVVRNPGCWLRDHKIVTLITAAIVLDWLPVQIFGQGHPIASGTRLIVFPLLLLDFLRDTRSYLRFNYAWLYMLGLLVGVGGGVLTGVIEFRSTLWVLLPNVAILMFYLKPRSWKDTRGILSVATAASVVVPIWLILVWQGVIEPDIFIESSAFTRFFAGPNRGSLSLLVAFIPATLGGLLLTKSSMRHILLASGLIALSLFAPLLTGQIAANLVVWVCLVLAIVSLVRYSNLKSAIRYIFVILALVIFAWGLWERGLEIIAQPITLRLQGYGEAKQNIEFRRQMYVVFFDELRLSPSLISTGHQTAYSSLGAGYHFLIGEAYAVGGLFLSGILLIGLISAGVRLIRFWFRSNDSHTYNIVTVLVVLFVGFLISQFTHAGLNIRVIYMLLGLWLALGKGQNP